MTQRNFRACRPSRAAVILGLFLGPQAALAGSSSYGEEYLSAEEAAEPNVIFLVDLSSAMNEVCPVTSYYTEGSESEGACIDEVADAIDQITQHFDWARYAVVGTAEDASAVGEDMFTPIVALGASHAEVSDAVDGLTAFEGDTRNLGEALSALGLQYLTNSDEDDLDSDEDGDGYSSDFSKAPIQYHCQETHVIIITVEQPEDDEDAIYTDTVDGDIICDQDEIVTSPDEECLLDNVAYGVYNGDFRTDLDNDQNIITHVVGIGLEGGVTVPEALFGNSVDQTDGEGIYIISYDSDLLVGSLLTIMADIRSGVHSRSAPVITTDGDYLVYGFYEIEGENPLAEGHLRAYTLDDDPSSETYGQIEYLSGGDYDDYGGAYWDAGDLLQSRPAFTGSYQFSDMDGDYTRDIFTFVDEMMGTSLAADALDYRRMPFDATFADALQGERVILNYFLDNTALEDPPCADDDTYDLDADRDCVVDYQDMQALIDFSRGWELASYRYLDKYHGYWKLGDSPHSTPAVVTPRNDAFSVDPSYRSFLKVMEEDTDIPSMVYLASNAGMLHAFYLEDDTSTSHTEEGEEAWAWVPGYLLYREHEADWAGRLIDQMLYGRTFLFDGSPVVDDVWIDENADGARDCDEDVISDVSDLEGNCEWHRVLVVQQGKGGPVTLALDVTDPLNPMYLWEQVDERVEDTTYVGGMGYLVGPPVITKVYDVRDSEEPGFHYVAIWGSGRAVPSSVGDDYYNATEANLYMWAIGDDYFLGTSSEWNETEALLNASGSETWGYSDGYKMDEEGSAGHPEWDEYSSDLDADGDGNYEYGYIAASLTVVDTDSDGDSDVIYFPVSSTYGSKDDDPAAEPGDGPQDPGPTWMWKALIDTTAPDEIEWCETAFFDPLSYVDDRPSVYYAATASWFSDGTLGLYWGTGTPFDRMTTDPGYFFAVRDPDPDTCSTGIGITCDGQVGVYELGPGEGLTSNPIIYAGVVYFTTYQPEEDICDGGDGRVYGLMYDDCSPGMDTDGDGDVDENDLDYEDIEGYPSQVAISSQGTIFVGSSDASGTGAGLTNFSVATDPFLGTQSIAWMEVF